jgi:hypothetical protein
MHSLLPCTSSLTEEKGSDRSRDFCRIDHCLWRRAHGALRRAGHGAEGRATPAAVAAALSWALAQCGQLIHLSLGLPHDRAVLAQAISRVIAAGAVIVASTPARGMRTYPAAYAGVIRATGDARCGREEISHLATPWADFGACAVHGSPNGHSQRGASIGAAHLTRFILAHLPPSTELAAAVSRSLVQCAAYRGAERRAVESISSD